MTSNCEFKSEGGCGWPSMCDTCIATSKAQQSTIEITKESLIDVTEPRFPRSAYRGEFRGPAGEYVANIYVVNHRAIIASPREFGNGEIDQRVPGDFDPKLFERAGGFQWTSRQYVSFWRLKKSA